MASYHQAETVLEAKARAGIINLYIGLTDMNFHCDGLKKMKRLLSLLFNSLNA
jgi:hypothetical protein